MKHWKIAPILCLSLPAVFMVSMPAFSDSTFQPRNAFILILNGIRYSDAFGDRRHLYVENMWEKIRPCGTLCKNVYNNSSTLPLPAQAVLLTGAPAGGKKAIQELHNPTLFEYYRKQTVAPKEKVVFAVSDSRFTAIACSNASAYGNAYAPTVLENDSGETDGNAIYKKTIHYIKEHHPSLVVLSLTTGKPIHHHITEKECKTLSRGLNDECGTAESLNMYYEGIILDDMIIMKLWEIIRTDEVYKGTTVFLVISSQGRHTDDYTSYGDNCEGCGRLLFLIAGPGIRKNHISGKKRYLTDVLPTIGKAMGIKTEHAAGKIMNEIFSGE